MSKSKTGTSYNGAILRMQRDERLAAQTDPAEQARRTLESHERVIENARRSFVALGKALLAIRSDRLYAAEYSTFAEYCEVRWDVSETYANRMINAALVAIEATPIGVEINSEAVARELVGLDQEALRQVWDEATRRAAGGRVTAALVKEVRRSLEPPKPEALEGEIVDPVSKFPAVENVVNDFINTQTSELSDADDAAESGQDHTDEDASGTADRDASSAQPGASGVTPGSAPAEHVETPPGPEDSTPADEPERAAEGVPLPAPATNLVNTPVGPMPADFAKKLDQLVPDPNPHREWQKAFLNNVFAAAKAMRGYSGAEIAEKADAELRAEFARFVGDMESLLHETSRAQLAAANNVRPLRRVQ